MADNFNFCKSQMKISTETFIWTIERFSERPLKFDPRDPEEKYFLFTYLESGIITSISPYGNPVKWQLKMYPEGCEGEGIVHTFIRLVDSEADEVHAIVEYWIRDANGVDKNHNANKKRCFTKSGRYGGTYFGEGDKFVTRDELLNQKNDLLPHDRLTIVCKVTILEEKMECARIDDFGVPECRMVEDIGKLFDKRDQFGDCTLIAQDGKEFKAHKTILACRSPVFGAMFDHDETIEAQEGTVKIEDIKSGVLEEMLRFIYTENVPKLDEMAKELFEAADKYQLDRLKVLCERSMANSIGTENVCELLDLANRHSVNHLKTRASEYIKMNAVEVMKSDGWKMLTNGNNADLIGQLMICALEAGK